MSDLTKEYFDTRLHKLQSDLESKIEEESHFLARITNERFDDLKKELDVRSRVERLEKDHLRIKQALI